MYSIITLLFHLRDHNKSWFQRNLQAHQNGKGQQKWLSQQERMCCVEIFWMDKLHRVHFAVPHLCNNVSSKRQSDMENKVFDRSNIDKKLETFMEASTSLYAEMKGQRKLVDCGAAALFDARSLEKVSSTGFFLSVFLTIILLATYRALPLDETSKFVTFTWVPYLQDNESLADLVDTLLVVALLLAGVTMVLLNLYSLIAAVLMRTTLVIAQEKGFMHVFWDFALWLRASFLICSILGLYFGSVPDMMWYSETNERNFINPEIIVAPQGNYDFFKPASWKPERCTRPMHNSPLGYTVYAVQLVDIFKHNDKAQYVLMAIKGPAAQIVATLLLMCIFVFIFAALAFTQFRNVLVSNNQCATLQSCFMTVLNYAPRLSGGIGDFLSPHIGPDHHMYSGLYTWSLVAFLFLNVIMLNVLFGIIVDTFGELRATEADRNKDISNICYICGLDRQTLDRKGDGFQKHISTDHYKWNYMKYIVYLKEKEVNDYNGLEHHVVNCIKNKDNGWFPVNRAMCLMENNENQTENSEARERREILQILSDLQEQILEMRSNMSDLTAAVKTSLPSETPAAKFANVVDNVMQKSRVSRILQQFVSSRKQKEK